MSHPLYILVLAAFGFWGVLGASTLSWALNLKQVGDQLLLSGPIEVGDEIKVQDALKQAPPIRSVILRNSPGGDVLSAYAIGNMFRARRMRTAISGFCNSGCSLCS